MLAGNHVAITGAGDGIGQALALECARRGAMVSALDIRLDPAEAVAEQCRRIGPRAAAFSCDVSDRRSVDTVAAAAAAELGPVNLVCANAGIGIRAGLLDAEWSDLEWLYGVNLFGVIATVRAFLPHLAADGAWRHVAITGSMAAMAAIEPERPTAYGASKYAVAGVAEALRCELAPLGIGVTLFSPGSIDTGKQDAGRARPARFGGVFARPLADQKRPPSPLSAERAAVAAIDAVLAGDFHCLLPEDAGRAARVAARAAEIAAHIALP